MAILSTLESSTLNETIRSASKWFILTLKKKKQNLEFVNPECVPNAQPIPLSLTIRKIAPQKSISRNSTVLELTLDNTHFYGDESTTSLCQ